MSSLNFGYLANWKGLREKCSREGCGATALRHPLAGRKSGIRLGEGWFCAEECFREGVAAHLRQMLDAASRRPLRHPSRMPLGLLLLSRGCITQAQLQIAKREQRAHGGAIGEVLCDLRFATEQQVTAAAATQWGCPVFSPKLGVSDIQARIPHTLMKLCSMAPVHYAAARNQLLVGFVHAIEHQALDTIEHITSCRASPCFITATECAKSIRNLAAQNTEVAFERVASAAEMANIVQSYAFQIGADEARLAICRDYVWIRLNREDFPTDLLFLLRPRDIPDPEHDPN
jgi:hypothetical protein